MDKRFFKLVSFLTLTISFICIYLIVPQSVLVNGGCLETSSPYMNRYFNDGREISFCSDGDASKSEIKSLEFSGKNGALSFDYAGYPMSKGLDFYLVSKSGDRLKIELQNTGEEWQNYSLNIPQQFSNHRLYISAIDNSTDSFGWLGLGTIQVHQTNLESEFLIRVVLVSILFSISTITILTVLLSKFSLYESLAMSMVSVGLYGYVTFFIYLKAHNWGVFLSFGLIFPILYTFFWIHKTNRFSEFKRSVLFILPLTLLTIFILTLGYFPFRPVPGEIWQIAANRWLNLPIDNWLPKIFADQIWDGNIKRPMIGDWLSSDRPPLQTGVFLIFYPLMSGSSVLYQTVATFLQLFIVPATWLLLSMFGFVKTRVSLIFSLFFSSLVLLHSLFVWPKLISAVYVIIFFSFLWSKPESKIRNFLIGSSAALAMLSHGGAFFALAGICLVWIFTNFKNKPTIKTLKDPFVWIGIFLFIYFPWVLYGKFIDPDNARLLKWHLAGLIEPSGIGFLHAFVNAYSNLTFSEWINGRIENTLFITNDNILPDLFRTPFSEMIEQIRKKSFYEYFYSMWMFSPAIAILGYIICGYRKLPPNFWILSITSFICLIIWSLLMFESRSTLIHQGSFFPWIICYICSAILIWESSKKVYFLLILINLSISCLIYINNQKLVSDEGLIYWGILLIIAIIFLVSLIRLDHHEKSLALVS